MENLRKSAHGIQNQFNEAVDNITLAANKRLDELPEELPREYMEKQARRQGRGGSARRGNH